MSKSWWLYPATMSGSYSQIISKKRVSSSFSSLQGMTSPSIPAAGFASRIRVLCPLYAGSKEKLIMIMGETSGEGIPPSKGRHSISKERYFKGAIARLSTLFNPDARIAESHAKFSRRELPAEPVRKYLGGSTDFPSTETQTMPPRSL